MFPSTPLEIYKKKKQILTCVLSFDASSVVLEYLSDPVSGIRHEFFRNMFATNLLLRTCYPEVTCPYTNYYVLNKKLCILSEKSIDLPSNVISVTNAS